MRFGIVHSEIKFPFASALTFRYLCHSKIISKNKYLQKFFNTSGQKYRELNLKNRISTIPEKELIELLASDGKLIKRPLLVTDSQVLVGFNAELWQDVLLSETK